MNVFAVVESHVRDAVSALVRRGDLSGSPDLAKVVVEPPRDASHGDIATNAAMVLAREAGLQPRALAERIAEELRAVPDVERVDIAGPGFINLTLRPSVWPRVLAAVLEQAAMFGRPAPLDAPAVNVEYVSVNPTGPLHVGHCRGTVVGDALASLLAFSGRD